MKLLTHCRAVAIVGIVLVAAGIRADEADIRLDQLPKAVVKAVKAKYPDAKLVAAEKETQGDKTFYEVMIKSGKQDIELLLTPDGKVVSIEQKIDARDLPRKVTAALEKTFPKASVKAVEETIKDGKSTYAVLLETQRLIDKEKQKVMLRLTSDGAISAWQKRIAVKDLPDSVTASLAKKYPDAKIVRANEIKDAKTTYLAILSSADKTILAMVDGDGKIIRESTQTKKK